MHRSCTDLIYASLHSLPEVIFNATYFSRIIQNIFSKVVKKEVALEAGLNCEPHSPDAGSLTCADPVRASFAHLTIMSGCSAEPGRIKVTLMLSENPYANPNKVCGLSKPICSSSGHDT